MNPDGRFLVEWERLADGLGLDRDAAARVGAALFARHEDTQRHYHNAAHIEAVLGHLATLHAATPTALLAAYFHDAIYDPTSADNEAASAELAADSLGRLGVSPPMVDDVVFIIIATADHALGHHALGPDAPVDTAAFLDADLAILGADPATYTAYANAIRAEYRHVNDQDFRAGRIAVLDHLLARAPLYYTRSACAHWSASARVNLTAERASLE